MKKADEQDLKAEIADMQDRFRKLQDSELFVAWFLKCFVTEKEEEAIAALVGGPKDKSLDAIYVDEQAKKVFIVQGKYRQQIGKGSEKRSDVIAFADLARTFTDNDAFSSYLDGLDPAAAGKAEAAQKRIRTRGYRLQLYYVTTGGCSSDLMKEADRIVRQSSPDSSIDIISGKKILLLLEDYLAGVAPPIPLLELEIESGQGIDLGGVLQRYDRNVKIESWVFPVNVRHIAEMYEQSGIRLFARNVRGFLGNTAINENMKETLEKEPEFFWYYNNGITIICDQAEQLNKGGRKLMKVVNPQVINGQQTTRTLHQTAAKNAKATVLVRVISVPRENDSESTRFDKLVSKIVAATNWQNAIKQSDLMSNDRRQIDLERNLRKLDYQYVRKRQTKAEARRQAGVRHRFFITKEELAQIVAACELDPSIVRGGKEQLFEERFYDQVFPNSEPNYYLPRYWLVKYVSKTAKGYPQRAYAKWVVTNFVWQEVKQIIRTKHLRELFVRMNEGKKFQSVEMLCEAAFKGVMKFYRANKGTGEKAADVSTFFQRKDLHTNFQGFWKCDTSPHKMQFSNALKRFHEDMRKLSEE